MEDSCSAKLQHWANNVMGYPGTLSAQDWKLLCEGDLGKFWLNVVNSTQSHKVVAAVKSTLLIQHRLSEPSKQKDDEKLSLLEQRNRLARERAALRNGIKLKNAEIDKLHAKLSSLEQDNQTSHDNSAELVTRCSLLSGHVTSCDQWCQMIKEFEWKVQAHNNYLASQKANRSGEVSYVFSRTSGHGSLESLTTHVVKDTLFCIRQSLDCLTDENADPSAVQEAKGRAWNSVEQLLSNHSITDILWSLCDVSVETEKQLRHHTSNINLKHDTKQLRLQCQVDSGELRDTSNRALLLETIHSYIKGAQTDHVSRSQTIEQSRVVIQNTQQKLVVLQQQANQLLAKHYQTHPHLLQLAKNLMELECELAGRGAALKTLLSFENNLLASCEQQQSIQQELSQKHKRIQEYTERTATKQDTIQLLIKQNSDAKHLQLKKRREVMSYAQQRVASQHALLVVSIDSLLDISDHESQLLGQLKLQHSLNQHEINRVDVLAEALGCHGYQSPELMLDKVAELLQRAKQLRKELREKEEVPVCDAPLYDAKINTNCLEVHSQLMDEICLHTQQVILPQLRHQLHKANNGIQECAKIRTTIDMWWAQPAQLLVPWVTQKGMSANQWLEQWRTLLTRLE